MDAVSSLHCSLTPKTEEVPWGFEFLMACEDFFHLENRAAYPVRKIENSVVVLDMRQVDVLYESWIVAFKMICYCTIILPLIIGTIVLILRSCYSYQITLEGIQLPRPQETQDVNHVVNGLYIGNGHGFLECTTGLTVPDRTTGNPRGFTSIVTMCPILAMRNRVAAQDVSKLKAPNSSLFNGLFLPNIRWYYFGRNIQDIAPEDIHLLTRRLKWEMLVCDATFGEEFDACVMNSEQITNFAIDKGCRLLETPVQDWFKQAFAVLDRAVFQGERVLVHCSEGWSRSSALIVAYFVNRFHMSVDNAIAYLKQRRPVVSVRFRLELLQYQLLLRHSRADRGM